MGYGYSNLGPALGNFVLSVLSSIIKTGITVLSSYSYKDQNELTHIKDLEK